MKVGMIFECGPDGADRKVCEHLARRLRTDIEVVSVTLDFKPKLLADCGLAAIRLLREGCEHVVIVWDLHPPWRSNKQQPCRREDRETILGSLEKAGVGVSQVSMVCIEEELEAWLIADGRALSKILSRPAHPARVPDVKNPEQTRNPKKHLRKVFQQHGRSYSELIYARKIIEALPDLTRIRRCATFVRFEVKMTGRKP